MTAGTVNIFIPLNADGTRMTGEVPKGQRARATFTPSRDVRTFFDPLADRNLPGAIMPGDRAYPKAKPFDPRFAPKGWTLRPVVAPVPVPVAPAEIEVPAEHCGKAFRTPSGYAWHLANAHAVPA